MIKGPQLVLWEAAVEGAKLRQHQPSPSDVFIPWSSHVVSATVCTAAPDPSPSRVTLFVRTREQPSELARRLNKDFLGRSIPKVAGANESEQKPTQRASSDKVSLVASNGERCLTVERVRGGRTYGDVLAVTSLNAQTRVALERFVLFVPMGCACLVPHDVAEVDVETVRGPMKLIRRTGTEKRDTSAGKLATIFELRDVAAPCFDMPPGCEPPRIDRDVVARCVVGYRDGSVWPCVGPSIVSIEVRRDYQGCALVQDMFNCVERWFVESWWLNTLGGNRVLKGTRLSDVVVDRVVGDDGLGTEGGQLILTDKIFCYEVMGFTTSKIHVASDVEDSAARYVPEAEAMKYYPPVGTLVPLPTVNYACWSANSGWRSCDHCGVQEAALTGGLLVCGGCSVPVYWRAHYCSKKCQREDWDRHKLFCKRSYEEVCKAKEAYERSLMSPRYTPRRRLAGKRKLFWLI